MICDRQSGTFTSRTKAREYEGEQLAFVDNLQTS